MNGLDNFEVGVSNVFPTEGSPVSTDSYEQCGQYSGSVNTGMEIVLNCPIFTQRYRYVIVRSLDQTPEYLCMAEVAVYNES